MSQIRARYVAATGTIVLEMTRDHLTQIQNAMGSRGICLVSIPAPSELKNELNIQSGNQHFTRKYEKDPVEIPVKSPLTVEQGLTSLRKDTAKTSAKPKLSFEK